MNRLPFDPSAARGAKAADPTGGILSVSQITALVKGAIARELPRTLHVVGQISNLKRHSSGHLYFTLKDDRSELSCVMWRSAVSTLKFQPSDGLEVIATGSVDVFERSGRYQLYARRLEPRGVGALELAFRQLREKLAAEGLFDPAHKKPLPRFPQRIAVVTSPTGAAVRDMLQTFRRRYPCATVLLYPVRVQGETAAAEIADAIAALNEHARSLGGIDAMIVGRGGGSLEDLWAFNEERVARAIFASTIPVVSAVGHEIDVTIADLVADVRAATPTAAAELTVPLLIGVLDDLSALTTRLHRAVRHLWELQQARLAALYQRNMYRDPLAALRHREQTLDESATRLAAAATAGVHAAHQRLNAHERLVQRIAPTTFVAEARRRLMEGTHRLRWMLGRRMSCQERTLTHHHSTLNALIPHHVYPRSKDRLNRISVRLNVGVLRFLNERRNRAAGAHARLQGLSYRRTLERGYSITRRKKDRVVVRDPSLLRDGDRLLTETPGGEFESRVVDERQGELFDDG